MQRPNNHPETSHQTNAETITIHKLPLIPHVVELSDIKENGKLLTDDEIATIAYRIKNYEKSTEEIVSNRYSKKKLGTNYSLIIPSNNLENKPTGPFAIYKGKKHDKHIGEGAFGKVKASQDLLTGKWYAYKIQKTLNRSSKISELCVSVDNEYNILDHLHLGIVEPSYREGKTTVCNNYVEKTIAIFESNFMMKFIRGTSLETLTDPKKYIGYPASFWLHIAIEVLKSLHALNTNYRTIHRDIKPSNIFYDPKHHKIQFIDFGHAGKMVGKSNKYISNRILTPLYADIEIRKEFIKNQGMHHSTTSLTYDAGTELFAAITTIAEVLNLYKPPTKIEHFQPENNYFAQPNSILFYVNKRISCPMLRRDIVTFLNKMTSVKKTERTSIGTATHYFNELYLKALKMELKEEITPHTLMIHVDDLLLLGQKDRLAYLMELKNTYLKKIYLLDSNQTPDHVLFQLRREFEDFHLPIMSEILRHDDQQTLLNNASDFIKNLEEYRHQKQLLKQEKKQPSVANEPIQRDNYPYFYKKIEGNDYHKNVIFTLWKPAQPPKENIADAAASPSFK